MASRLGVFSKVISNDIMYYGYVMARAMLFRGKSHISNIRNVPEKYKGGFITEKYSSIPTGSGEASYFSRDNARKIDWIRNEIDTVKDEEIRLYLLASLLSSADKIANTASVYGAFLKKFKTSALKELNYIVPPISLSNCKGEVYNLSSEEVAIKRS